MYEKHLYPRAQLGGDKGAEAPLSQVKVEKKDKEILIFSRFHAYNPIKLLLQVCNSIIPSQLSNFVEFKLVKELFLQKYRIFFNFLRFGDTKSSELANFRS